jgi:lysophospholipase L1-like esterase
MMAANTEAQDWPFLSKYQEENSKVSNDKNAAPRIVFIGDSITEFWSTVQPQFFENKIFINRGISGQTSPQVLLRFRADVINLAPQIVVILVGGNDIAGNTGDATEKMILNNIYSMVELAEANKIKVILCSVLAANYFYWMPKVKPATAINSLNKSIQSYALAKNILYTDYYSALVDFNLGLPLKYSSDGVHPNAAGYEIMAPLILKNIKVVLDSL